MKCTNCGKENKNTNIRCEFCGTILNSINQNDNKDYAFKLNSRKTKLINNVILIFVLAPWFICGLAFIVVSANSNILDNNKSQKYLETEGKIVGYDDCRYDDGDELCTAIYEYVVNGVSYKGSPNLLSTKSGFKDTITVKYNPNDPNEYVMDSGWNSLLITGIIMVVIVSLIFISVQINFKKLNKTIKKDNQVIN